MSLSVRFRLPERHRTPTSPHSWGMSVPHEWPLAIPHEWGMQGGGIRQQERQSSDGRKEDGIWTQTGHQKTCLSFFLKKCDMLVNAWCPSAFRQTMGGFYNTLVSKISHDRFGLTEQLTKRFDNHPIFQTFHVINGQFWESPIAIILPNAIFHDGHSVSVRLLRTDSEYIFLSMKHASRQFLSAWWRFLCRAYMT